MRNPENFIWISSAPGAHGKFLQSIIFWLANDIVPTKQFFTNINYHQQGADVQSYTNIGDRGTVNLQNMLDVKFNDDNSCKTMTFAGGMDHPAERFESKFIDQFQKFKWITVTTEEIDWLSIDLNHYFKLDRNLYTQFLPPLTGLNFQNPTVAVDIIKRCYEIPGFNDRKKIFSREYYFKTLVKLEKYKDAFDYLEYRDILLRPDYVMSKICEWTEKPINDFIQKTYYKYLEAQKRFLKKVNPGHFLVA